MRIAVIDTDGVIYRSAAASEKRTVLVTHNPTGIQKEFKTRTEFRDMLKLKLKSDKEHEYTFEDVQTPEPIENCLHTVNSQMKKIKDKTAADVCVYVVGGEFNFRDCLLLPSKYKGHREDMLTPVYRKQAKEYVINKFNAEVTLGEESDDAVIYKGYELQKAGHEVVVVSMDKDSLQADGLTLFDFSTDKYTENTDHWFKTEKKNKVNKPYGSGVGFLAYQLCCGDTSDHYKPTELCGAKYGVMSFAKDVADCKTAEDYLKVVVQKYKEWYPEPITYTAWNSTVVTKDWKGMLDLYFKTAYMKRTKDDKSCSIEFFGKYGVDL